MDRSSITAAAISWMIACGLLFGGAATLGTASAAASPGTAGSGHDGHQAGGESGSNSPAAGRPGSHHSPGPQRVGDTSVSLPGPGGLFHHAPDVWTGPGDGEGSGDPGWPWWPWPWPPCGSVGTPGPRNVGGGGSGGLPQSSGGGIAVTGPTPSVPGQPGEPSPVEAGGGTIPLPATGEPATINMPPVIGAPPVLEAPLRPIGTSEPNGSAPQSGQGGRAVPANEPEAGRPRSPVGVGNATEAPASFRVGYPEYLREAKTGEIAALALPGVAGLLALTALGGFLGYRQARAGHLVRATGTARFLQ